MRLKLAGLAAVLVCSFSIQARADAIQQDFLWTTPLTTTVAIGLAQPPLLGGPFVTTEEIGPFGPVAPGDLFFLSLSNPVIADIAQYLDVCGPGVFCGNYPNDVRIVFDPGPEDANGGICPGLACSSFGNYYTGTLTYPGPGSVIDGVVIDVTSNSVEYGVYGTGLLPTSTPEPPAWLLTFAGLLALCMWKCYESAVFRRQNQDFARITGISNTIPQL